MADRLISVAAFFWITVTVIVSASASMAADKEALFQALKSAPTEDAAREIENEIWLTWLDEAPDAKSRELVDTGMSRRKVYDLDGALKSLNEAVELYPNYAEAWNQRAFVLFLKGNLDASLEDVDQALELEPRHFGALAGKALILLQQGRIQLSQNALRQAVEIHPFLKERHMLVQPKGQDL